MKRSGPPERRTPLNQGAPLNRGRPPERKTALRAAVPTQRKAPEKAPARQPPAKPRRYTGLSETTRNCVVERDVRCLNCGAAATDIDHRRGRGAGGQSRDEQQRTDTPAWAALLCGAGNTSGCHGRKESDREWGERNGWRLPRNGRPVDATCVPVLTRDGWQLLDDEGRRVPCPAPPNDDARECW